MRLGVTIEALARRYNIHLVCIAISESTPIGDLEERYEALCSRILSFDVRGRAPLAFEGLTGRSDGTTLLAEQRATEHSFLTRHATPALVQEVCAALRGKRFDAIHVARLAAAPFVEPLLRAMPPQRPRCVLDLDDIESKTQRRIGALHEGIGDPAKAEACRRESEKAARLERDYLPLFDEVWVCSDLDRAEVRRLYGHPGVVTVPNAVRLVGRARPKPPGPKVNLLLVGVLTYFPNLDAAVWFSREVLPRIRERASRPVELTIVGPYRSERVRELAREPGVRVVGAAKSVSPFYRRADIALAPLRAGGGTRVKILEAFSRRRPVAATTLGAEGLAVTHGAEILLADSAQDFADACVDLIEHPQKAAAMAERAYAWLASHNTTRQLREALQRSPLRPA